MDKKDIGIFFNKEQVDVEHEKKYRKNITFNFSEGKAVLYKENRKGKLKKIDVIEDGYKLKRNGSYELIFVNKDNLEYHIKFELRKRFLLIIILLFLLGAFIGFSVIKSNHSNVNDYINLNRILDVSIFLVDSDIESNDQYIFNIQKKPNIVDKEQNSLEYVKFISLMDNYNPETLTESKIAPGTSGSFKIIIKSDKAVSYSVDVLDVLKPKNMYFTIDNNTTKYYDFRKLTKDNINGNINKKEKKSFVINWYWDYESDDDMQDTSDSITDFYIKINLSLEE